MQTKEQGKQSARSMKSAGGSGRRTRTNRSATASMSENLSPEAAHCLEGIGAITRVIISVDGVAGDFDRLKLALFGTCHQVCDGLSPSSFKDEEAKLAKSLTDLNIGKHGNSATHHQRLVKEALERACQGRDISKSTRALVSKYSRALVGMRISGVNASNFEEKWFEPASQETNWKKGLDRYLSVYDKEYAKSIEKGSDVTAKDPSIEAAEFFLKNGGFSAVDDSSVELGDFEFSRLLRLVMDEAARRNNLMILIDDQDDAISEYEISGPHDDNCVYLQMPESDQRPILIVKKFQVKRTRPPGWKTPAES